MLSLQEAFLYTAVMALVIFACRLAPFIVFGKAEGTRGERSFARACAAFAERAAPPAAMTVLACNACAGEIAASPGSAVSVLAACAITALLHIWKRNAFLSIACGVAAYSALRAVMGG